MGPGFESLKLHQWPIGQVVKTAASHAVNIGSNPVWVTKVYKTLLSFYNIFLDITAPRCYNAEAVRSQSAFDIYRWGKPHRKESVLIVVWVHLFPSRTQKLSTCTPTIVAG